MVKFQKVWLAEIEVGARLRPLDAVAVGALAQSIERMGLQTPISLRVIEDERGEIPVLIAGYHRLMAMKQLGHETAMCAVHDGGENEARLWEIAENLHRADLSVQERADHIAEWVRLTDVSHAAQLAPHGKGGQQPGGINAAVRELGIERTEAQRAVKIASIAPEAKQAASEAGISDNQSALLRVSKEQSPAAQLAAVIREKELEATRKTNRLTDQLVAERRIYGVKEWLGARLDVTEMHELGEMLAGISDVLSKAFMREAA